MTEEKDLQEIMAETMHAWNDDTYSDPEYAEFRKVLEYLKSLPPHPPEEQKPKKEPRWFAYFDDGYDSQWMESYHTKKEALADIKIHRDSFECLIKGKIVK